MPELSTIYDYMRCHATPLGERILQEYPALHHFDDPVSIICEMGHDETINEDN